jgi:hypothetical protein
MFSFTGFAATTAVVNCEMKLNASKISQAQVQLAEGVKLRISEFEGFRIYLERKTKDFFVLEIFDGDATLRTYSETHLRLIGDVLNSAIWKREALIETSCLLHSL